VTRLTEQCYVIYCYKTIINYSNKHWHAK